jgi:AcrR family transcriptional regulator
VSVPAPHRAPTRRRENTRARLRDAAYEVFAEVGLDAASVEAICERAGFTRGAFYSNFASKDELFLELAAAVADRKLARVTERVEALRGQERPPSSVEQIARAVLDIAGEDPLTVVLMAEVRLRAMRDDETAAAYRRWDRDVRDRVSLIVAGLADAYGLRLRVPAPDLARLVVDVWETTATASVVDRLDREQMCFLAMARIEQLVVALVDDPRA